MFSIEKDSPRARIWRRFNSACERGEFLVGAAIGAGIFAQAAEQGGADFVLALNAGRMRIMGAASVACMLPIRDSNKFVQSFAPTEILSLCSVPVYFGASTLNPRQSPDEVADRIVAMGFEGVVNFPTVAHYPKQIRAALESAGLGFSKELALFSAAHARGLSTLAHVLTAEQARSAAAQGVDIICFNFGWNAGGDKGLASTLSVEEAASHARALSRVVARENPRAFFVLEGGPIEDPQQLTTVCRVARIHGYVGGSTIDRLPLAESVKEQTRRFKSAAVLARVQTSEEYDLIGFGRRLGLVGSSEAMIRVYQQIKRLRDSRESMIVSGERGTGRQKILRALHSLAGAKPESLAVLDADELTRQQLIVSLFGRAAAQGQRGELVGLIARDDIAVIAIRGIERVSLKTQARLAAYIEHGHFTPVGGRRPVQSEKRILLVSDEPLSVLLASERINRELADQLSGHEISLPALRERAEDIEALLSHAIDRLTDGEKLRQPVLSPAASQRLKQHHWPGNLTELRAFAGGLVSRYDGARVGKEAVLRTLAGDHKPARRSVASERDIILDALWRHGFHRGRAAVFLGISRKTLYNKIKHYGLTG